MKISKITAVLILIIFVFSGCEKDSKGTGDIDKKESATLSFKFNPKFKGESLNFNQMKYINAEGDTMSFQRVNLILSNFELIKSDGETIKLDTFAYLNLAEGRNLVEIDGNIPEGDYKGIKFMIGLDSSINHGDPNRWSKGHPLNPIVNNMHWGWQGGYIFWVCEGYYMNNGNDNQIFSFHMATLKYLKTIELESSNIFKIKKGNPVSKEINVHLDKYFSEPLPYSLKKNGDISHASSEEENLRMDVLYNNLSSTFELK